MAKLIPTVDRAINMGALALTGGLYASSQNGSASFWVFRWGATVIPNVYDNTMTISGLWQYSRFATASSPFPSAVASGTITSLDFNGSSAAVQISGLSISAPAIDAQLGDPAHFIFQGDDTITGSSKGDVLKGYAGADTIMSAAGGDTVDGGAGANYLRGEDGDDSIVGGTDFDDINGNQGNDTCVSGGGDDWVVGGKDNDSLTGSAGQNLVYGNLGADTCEGGDGNDIVRGGQDNDIVRGGNGDDFVSGDKGDDTMTGGAGADIFHTFGDAGIDRVLDFSLAQGDRVMLDPGTQFTVSQAGADTVISMTGGGQMILVGVSMSSLTGNWIFGA